MTSPANSTREQYKARTRERLLIAARSVFLEKGFVSSSVRDIAEAAGYTRGAFYSSIGVGAKAALLLELLRRDQQSLSLPELSDCHIHRANIESLIAACCRHLIRYSDCFPLWAEAALVARHEPEFRKHFAALQFEKASRIHSCIARLLQRADPRCGIPVEHVTMVVLGLCEGLQLFRLSDRILDDDVVSVVIARYLAQIPPRRP
ncbi:TetR/AcrR family transcriptional regulator [Burkholderia sp. BCC1972]|uniref:TetR/AcrR family transcriptional regulator n=1 Tax=Burkholderia sp. BCC1972 TaxID=2817438 RepID=UPI0039F1BA77